MLFKRAIPLGSKNLLGNKDRKKLRSVIVKSFPTCSESQVDTLLLKDDDTLVMKVQGSKTVIYFSLGEPMFFDLDGTGELIPSIYALTRIPQLLPCFLIHESVSRFILGGADLMVPGVLSPTSTECYGPDGLLVKKVMGVRVAGSPVPFAVGKCAATNTMFGTGKGKALDVLHVYGDALWNLGSRIPPSPGFTLKKVGMADPPVPEDPTWYAIQTAAAKPTPTVMMGSDKKEEEEDDDGWGAETTEQQQQPIGEEDIVDGSPEASKNVDTDVIPSLVRRGSDDVTSPPAITESQEPNPVPPPGPVVSHEVPPECHRQQETTDQLPVDVVDTFLELVLLEVLHTQLPESAYPIAISAVFSKMTQCASVVQFDPKFRQETLGRPGVPPECADAICRGQLLVPCDVKKSSYKKLTKLFQTYTKKKLLVTKEARGGEMVVTAVKRDSTVYTAYTPMSDKEKKGATRLSARASSSGATAEMMTPATAKAPSAAAAAAFVVYDLYRPTSSSQAVFEGLAPDVAGHYFTAAQCRQALTAYIEAHALTAPNAPASVVLDTLLQQCILPKDMRKAANAPVVLRKGDVFPKFLNSLQQFHAVTRNGLSAEELKIRRDKLKPIQLKVEKRQGRRAVTTVANIQSFEIDEKQLAETLQRALASSATTFELTGAAKGKDKPFGVMVQGCFVDAVADVLITQYGIPKRFIATT